MSDPAPWFSARYHVPRSQVWEGSRGRQTGHVHLHVTARFDLGRIHRAPGQALCGRRGWYERPVDEAEVVPLCPRCREIKERVVDHASDRPVTVIG